MAATIGEDGDSLALPPSAKPVRGQAGAFFGHPDAARFLKNARRNGLSGRPHSRKKMAATIGEDGDNLALPPSAKPVRGQAGAFFGSALAASCGDAALRRNLKPAAAAVMRHCGRVAVTATSAGVMRCLRVWWLRSCWWVGLLLVSRTWR
ncbi:MAG: hypothetical protein OD918_07645 [Gammaproteobacteria bacterium]